MDFIFDTFQEESEAGTAARLADLPPAQGMMAKIFEQPSRRILEYSERAAQDPEMTGWRAYLAGNAAAYGSTITDRDLLAPPTPLISPEETKKYSPDGTPLADKPIPQGLAEVIGRQKADKIAADSAIRRFQEAHSFPVNLATDIVASFTDPLNIAAAFIPGIGEEAIAARLGLGATFLGRTAARAISGATLGTAAQVPISSLEAAFDPDYGMRQFLYDVMVQAPINAAIAVVGAGTIREGYRYFTGAPPLNYAHTILAAGPQNSNNAMRAATAQIVDGRPVDVDGFFYRPPPTDTAIGLAMEPRDLRAIISDADKQRLGWQTPDVAGQADRAKTLFTEGWAPGIASNRLDRETAAVYERAEPTPTARPEPPEKPPEGWMKPASAPREIAPLSAEVPDYVRQGVELAFRQAERVGLLDTIERLFAEGKTAGEVGQQLGSRLRPLIGEGESVGNFIRQVRTGLGIPSMEERAEFEAWQKAFQERGKPTEAPAGAEPGAAAEAKPPEAPIDPEAAAALAQAEQTFAAIDHSNLTPEELALVAEAEDAQRGIDEADALTSEAASCILEAGE